MAEYITLKSRALEIYDYRQVDISQFLTGFVPDEGQLKKDMTRWLRRYGRTVSPEQVAFGDTVTLRCQSSLPRYNRESVSVPVGKGLFNRELESQLVGMATGERRILTVGDLEVETEVLSISRVLLPERTDESIAALGVEGIRSIYDLRLMCLEKQVEGFLLEDENPDMASAYIWQAVADHSRFERDAEECRHVDIQAEKRLKVVEEQYAGDLDDITVETFQKVYLTELDLATIGQALLQQENALLTIDDYEARLKKLADAFPGLTREQLMEKEDVLSFAMSYYADVLAQRIDGYVAQCFREAFVK